MIEPAKMTLYRETARRREAQRRRDLLAWRERARRLADEAAALLRHRFDVHEVILFGSVAREVDDQSPLPVHAYSDLDLAVWGLAEKEYLRAVSCLLDLGGPIDIDLARLEEASPRLRQIVETEGIPL